MTRLLVHVEGQTEETFVSEILAPHLRQRGYAAVSARLLGNARQRSSRGGIRGWNTVRDDILNHLKEDESCLATTMVDYYGLPQSGAKEWPGRAAASALPFDRKAASVEAALRADIETGLGRLSHPPRFIPFLMMHEFEGLLFSDCGRFGKGIGRPEMAAPLQEIRDGFNTPEEINDSPGTAPSKRIQSLVPGYQKPLHGALAALEIGLETMRERCPHFRQWLETLEGFKEK